MSAFVEFLNKDKAFLLKRFNEQTEYLKKLRDSNMECGRKSALYESAYVVQRRISNQLYAIGIQP